jgi:Protein of unknown function (DUF3617)
MKRALVSMIAALSMVPVVATAASLNMKPGLWEIHATTQHSGMPPIPADVLSKMTPDQRTRLDAALKAQASRPPTQSVTKNCVTQKDLDKPIPFDPGERDKSCKNTILKSTRTLQLIHIECSGAQRVSGDWKFEAVDPKSMTGSMDMKIAGAGNTMTVKSEFTGKWISASCPDAVK